MITFLKGEKLKTESQYLRQFECGIEELTNSIREVEQKHTKNGFDQIGIIEMIPIFDDRVCVLYHAYKLRSRV